MRTLICGSRGLVDGRAAFILLDVFDPRPTRIITGGARGADAIAAAWARSRGIPLTVITADWEARGRSAGFLRNLAMLEISDQVIAFWDGMSRGTLHTIDHGRRQGLPVFVFDFNGKAMG